MSSSTPTRTRADATDSHSGTIGLLIAAIVAVLIGRQVLALLIGGRGGVATWTTVFCAIVVQALPFLMLGVVLSGAITAFVPARFFSTILPKRAAFAVPVAGAAGALLPGCECASVPVAGRLMERGVVPAAALAFLLSAPAINPIVLVSTAVAFPGQPGMVVGRFVASLATAVLVGWIWARFGRPEWLTRFAARRLPSADDTTPAFERFRLAVAHDFFEAGGFLVIGAAAAATMNVVIPPDWISTVAGIPVLSILVLAALAVVLSICSEADAFVAASLTGFPVSAQLAFMVVGPVVDLKLIALQTGTFGRAFATRFAPLTFVVAVGAAVVTGLLIGVA
ncbi:permease [Cryptosporangium arvum]|uniref:Putative permease n=1 Tax=Cryptosporangium arvum DSM 44712 TaxID=927661 RepID=A0A011AAL9_9ACTN|nr:permease [Cryptosporangium arvum]EXG79066.1 putative permease [Cryptosporangium arvum DSM 44712]